MKQLFEGLYFRNGWRDLLQIWYMFSPDMPAPALANLVLLGLEMMKLQMAVKSYFVLCVNILTFFAHTPFSCAA